jgi:hypothetical protein
VNGVQQFTVDCSPPTAEVLDLLTRLVDKSLVLAEAR